ncbi:hypothetical protein FGF66_03425 [Chlorobaculum thiosulfatiphilum]|uniref:Uncharacterized protein n=1 Tax=Chlorobaculum thiosulfatiphilum TaxID=115852 RepID=A0A5C4S970_CHLTI|nr:hypothetical protein [Chlorobaculum thiosulfatiphilum]TNJ39688.1 hypothetical protein FGF66_03425 [Chlorobaculum thiosulfatiphilum]
MAEGGSLSNFFSRIFRKKVAKTPLEEFIATITPEQFQSSYRSVKDPTLRVPAALSTWVLYLAHRFSSGLREMLTSVEKTFETSSSYPYDCVAFEAAAFCHYWVVREFLNADEDEDGEPEGNDYFECLKNSANITSSLLSSKTGFAMPDDLLMKRSIAYSYEEKCKAVRPEEKFANLLISSMQSGSPTKRSPVGIQSSLPLQLCIASYIPIFESTLLAEFKKAARVMFLADQEGAL